MNHIHKRRRMQSTLTLIPRAAETTAAATIRDVELPKAYGW